MLLFTLKRLLLFLPTLLVLSWLAFGLSQCTPGDPVAHLVPSEFVENGEEDPQAYDRNYRAAAAQLGKDRPTFYFSITNAATPDTLHRIVRRDQKKNRLAMLRENGNWPLLQTFYRHLENRAWRTDQTSEVATARQLLLYKKAERVDNSILKFAEDDPIRTSWEAFRSQPESLKLYLPALHWHGNDNQYHRWMGALLSGDFGTSILNRQPVLEKIGPALKWTALLNFIAILLAYLISIPLGLYTAYYAGSRFDRYSAIFLFLLFSLPSFWVATMLNNFITTPVYGLDWFPTMGVGEVGPDTGFWSFLGIRIHHLFLPVLCLTYPALAYLSRQMRNAARHELNQAYVKTARLKGLSVHRILWGHVLRNALFPIITLLAGLLPSLLAGSVLIEIIFNLPGMGRLLVEGVQADDWPIVLAILLFNGVLTIFGILLADVLYGLADPRVRASGIKTETA